MSDAEEAERLSRKRARMMPILGMLLFTLQGSFLAADPARRAVDWGTTICWLLLAAVMLAFLVSGGFWLKPRRVRDLMNDDVTRANRASALTLGFAVAMVAAMALFAIDTYAPGEATTREALHIVVSLGLFAALVRFGLLERRALG
jgi:hypothetical protein